MDNCTRQCRNFDIGREILKSEKMNSLFWIYNLKLEGCRKVLKKLRILKKQSLHQKTK